MRRANQVASHNPIGSRPPVHRSSTAPGSTQSLGTCPERQFWRAGGRPISRHGWERDRKDARHALPRLGASHRPTPCGNRLPAHPVRWSLARRGTNPEVQVRHHPNDRRRYSACARGRTSHHRHALGALRLVPGRSVPMIPPARRRSLRSVPSHRPQQRHAATGQLTIPGPWRSVITYDHARWRQARTYASAV
jgi:hypothetical protein